jgi:O-acetyl-ADP-ribose deacetylase (regulator of RNase III)
MLKVVIGDIRNFSGDYVVNPSNTILELGSGVSGVLRMMCPELQRVMKDYVKKHGFLNPGDIAITIYPCKEYKYAIHPAVMDYRSGAKEVNPSYERIEKILRNIKDFLKDKKVKVITPLLGTGVGGLDKERVKEMMRKYLDDLESEVILVIRN